MEKKRWDNTCKVAKTLPKVKLTFTANANTTVSVYFTKESYDASKPDDTISLTTNQEKETIYDRESIYNFDLYQPSLIISAKIEGALLDCGELFKFCDNLTTLDLSNLDTSNVIDMMGMFEGCNKLVTLDVSNFDTSKVTDMSYMFEACPRLTTLDVTNFDTSNVIDMGGMFKFCDNLTTLDVSKFDTSKVTDMSNMFDTCSNLTTLDVTNFDTSKVTDMSDMFDNCSNLTTIGHVDTAPGWQHKPDNYTDMFYNCPATPKPSWYK